MKTSFFGVAFLLIAFLPQCIHDSGQTITDGVYRGPSKVESLTVKGQYMTLELNVVKGPRLGLIQGTYQYEVLTNQELRFRASSNDSFFVFTILAYDWIWNGKDIVRKHSETGQTVVFSRAGEAAVSP
jgi:hypothetical protein